MSIPKWVPIVSRRVTVLRTFLTARGCHDEIARYLGHGCDYLTITKNELSDVYFAAKDTKRVSELVLDRIKSNSNFPQQHSQDCREACLSLIEMSKKTRSFSEYCREYIRFAKFMGIPVALERMLTTQIEKAIADQVGQEQVAPFMAQCMISPELSEFQKEQLDLLQLVIDDGSVKAHADQYRWLGCYNIDESPHEDSYFQNRVDELKKQPKKLLERQINELKEQFEHDQAIYRDTMEQLKLDKNMQKQVELLREYVFLRTHRIEAHIKSNFYIQALFKDLASQLGLSLRQIMALRPEEIEQALADQSALPAAEFLEERCREYGFRYDENGIVLVTGKEVLELERKELGVEEQQVMTELRGTVAYKGDMIRARVQIVLTKEDIRNFQEGNILVTPMTTPEFVPIMKKAAAIVTNEGGVLCHTAIVARELKIPCLIGTQKATHVFKTGVLVEVDTNQGVVKLI